MAAEQIGRRGFCLEYEPAFVDVAIRRWQAYTKIDAVLEGDGRTFDEIAEERLKEIAGSALACSDANWAHPRTALGEHRVELSDQTLVNDAGKPEAFA